MSGSLQELFNKIMEGETVSKLFFNKPEYDSFRTSLLRKHRLHKKAFDDIGMDYPYVGLYLRCSFDKETVEGSFKLEAESSRKNLKWSERLGTL